MGAFSVRDQALAEVLNDIRRIAQATSPARAGARRDAGFEFGGHRYERAGADIIIDGTAYRMDGGNFAREMFRRLTVAAC